MLHRYETTKEKDGTIVIHDVPIFAEISRDMELGEGGVQTFDYNEEWINTAVKEAQRREKDQHHKPALFIEHNRDGKPIREIAGFLVNQRAHTIQYDGKPTRTVYADLVITLPEVFEEIRKGQFPGISVEIKDSQENNPQTFTAAALLNTEPAALKFDPLLVKDPKEEYERPKSFMEARKTGASYEIICFSESAPMLRDVEKFAEERILDSEIGMSREEMPQIKGKDFSQFLDSLKDEGIKITEGEISASLLKPTQEELDLEKVKAIKKSDKKGKPILISSDLFILDGHHRWKAQEKDTIDIVQIDMPIEELLEKSNEFLDEDFEESPKTSDSKKSQILGSLEWANSHFNNLEKEFFISRHERRSVKEKIIEGLLTAFNRGNMLRKQLGLKEIPYDNIFRDTKRGVEIYEFGGNPLWEGVEELGIKSLPNEEDIEIEESNRERKDLKQQIESAIQGKKESVPIGLVELDNESNKWLTPKGLPRLVNINGKPKIYIEKENQWLDELGRGTSASGLAQKLADGSAVMLGNEYVPIKESVAFAEVDSLIKDIDDVLSFSESPSKTQLFAEKEELTEEELLSQIAQLDAKAENASDKKEMNKLYAKSVALDTQLRQLRRDKSKDFSEIEDLLIDIDSLLSEDELKLMNDMLKEELADNEDIIDIDTLPNEEQKDTMNFDDAWRSYEKPSLLKKVKESLFPEKLPNQDKIEYYLLAEDEKSNKKAQELIWNAKVGKEPWIKLFPWAKEVITGAFKGKSFAEKLPLQKSTILDDLAQKLIDNKSLFKDAVKEINPVKHKTFHKIANKLNDWLQDGTISSEYLASWLQPFPEYVSQIGKMIGFAELDAFERLDKSKEDEVETNSKEWLKKKIAQDEFKIDALRKVGKNPKKLSPLESTKELERSYLQSQLESAQTEAQRQDALDAMEDLEDRIESEENYVPNNATDFGKLAFQNGIKKPYKDIKFIAWLENELNKSYPMSDDWADSYSSPSEHKKIEKLFDKRNQLRRRLENDWTQGWLKEGYEKKNPKEFSEDDFAEIEMNNLLKSKLQEKLSSAPEEEKKRLERQIKELEEANFGIQGYYAEYNKPTMYVDLSDPFEDATNYSYEQLEKEYKRADMMKDMAIGRPALYKKMNDRKNEISALMSAINNKKDKERRKSIGLDFSESQQNFAESDKPKPREMLQTIVAPKSVFLTLEEAVTKVKEEMPKENTKDPIETPTSWRFRQRDPGLFDPDSFITKKLQGLALVYADLLENPEKEEFGEGDDDKDWFAKIVSADKTNRKNDAWNDSGATGIIEAPKPDPKTKDMKAPALPKNIMYLSKQERENYAKKDKERQEQHERGLKKESELSAKTSKGLKSLSKGNATDWKVTSDKDSIYAPRGLPEGIEVRGEQFFFIPEEKKWVSKDGKQSWGGRQVANYLLTQQGEPLGSKAIKSAGSKFIFEEEHMAEKKRFDRTTKDLLDAFVKEKDPGEGKKLFGKLRKSIGSKKFAESEEALRKKWEVEKDPQAKRELDKLKERKGHNLKKLKELESQFKKVLKKYKNDLFNKGSSSKEAIGGISKIWEILYKADDLLDQDDFISMIPDIKYELENTNGIQMLLDRDNIFTYDYLKDTFSESRSESYESAPNYLESQAKLEQEIEDLKIEISALKHEAKNSLKSKDFKGTIHLSDQIDSLEDALELKEEELKILNSGERKFAEEDEDPIGEKSQENQEKQEEAQAELDNLLKTLEIYREELNKAYQDEDTKDTEMVSEVNNLVRKLDVYRKEMDEAYKKNNETGDTEAKRIGKEIVKIKDTIEKIESKEHDSSIANKIALKIAKTKDSIDSVWEKVLASSPEVIEDKSQKEKLTKAVKELLEFKPSLKLQKRDEELQKLEDLIKRIKESKRKADFLPETQKMLEDLKKASGTEGNEKNKLPQGIKFNGKNFLNEKGDGMQWNYVSVTGKNESMTAKEVAEALTNGEAKPIGFTKVNAKFAEEDSLQFPEAIPDEVITNESGNLVMYKFNTEENGYQIKAIIAPSGESLPIEEDSESIFSLDMLVDPQPVPGTKYIEEGEDQEFGLLSLIESVSPAKMYMKYIMGPMTDALGASPDSDWEKENYPNEYDTFSEVSSHLKETALNAIPDDPNDKEAIKKNKTLFKYYLNEFIDEKVKEGLVPIQIDTELMKVVGFDLLENYDDEIKEVFSKRFPKGLKSDLINS